MSFVCVLRSTYDFVRLEAHARLLVRGLSIFSNVCSFMSCSLVAWGVSGSLLQSSWTQIWAQADGFGLILKFLRRLVVIFVRGVSISQRIIETDGSALLTPAMR